MLSSERAEFDQHLGTLCAGFNVPMTELRGEAYWRGLAKMHLSTFARVVEHALGQDGPERIPTAPQCWALSKQLRAQRPRAPQAESGPTVEPLVAFGNRCLLKLLRETCGTDPETLARLVAEKNRLAADFRLIATEEALTAAEVREAMFAGFQRVSGLRLAQP